MYDGGSQHALAPNPTTNEVLFGNLVKDGDVCRQKPNTHRCTCRDALIYYNKCGNIQSPNPFNPIIGEDGKAWFLVCYKGGNIDKVEELINFVESQLKIEKPTTFYKAIIQEDVSDSCFIASIDPVWIERNYLLSLWSLIIRIGLRYYSRGVYSNITTPEQFLKEANTDWWTPDRSLGSVKQKYYYFIENGIYMQEEKLYNNNPGVGISNIQIPNFNPSKYI